jgi:hypothetical protein
LARQWANKGENMVTLTFTIDELNFILGVLSERQFKEVASLIMKVKDEAEKQLAPVVSQPE